MTTTSTRPELTEEMLTEEMLARFDQRAPQYDRDNRFFHEDFAELSDAGYLRLALPVEYGGAGLTLAEIGHLQQRLAYVAPATAVAVNMHFCWTGAAADMLRTGDRSMVRVLENAAAGHVFAAGHGETGNDIPLLLSTTTARRVEGGWEFTGHKIFGSLSPVWTYLGVHGMDTSDPTRPMIVHGFLPRHASGYRIEQTWDTLGMRATESNDTILDRAFVPDSDIALVCPAGFGGAGLFQVAVLAWAMLGFAHVYAGIAQRAYHLTVKDAHRRTSIALTRPMAYHPEVQHDVAEMRIKLEAIDGYLGRVAQDWSTGVDHATEWPLKLMAARHFAVTNAWSVVDTALDLAGVAGIFRRNRMEMLFRDARLGRIHPSGSALTHEVVAKLSLGIDPDEQPRWG